MCECTNPKKAPADDAPPPTDCRAAQVPDYTLSQRLQLCGGCKQARFCSKECAKRAWKNGHKMECAALAKELQEQGGAIAPS